MAAVLNIIYKLPERDGLVNQPTMLSNPTGTYTNRNTTRKL